MFVEISNQALIIIKTFKLKEASKHLFIINNKQEYACSIILFILKELVTLSFP